MTDTQWRIATPKAFAPQAERVQLPSQIGTEECVLLRKPDIMALIRGDGDVPDVLTNLVLSSLDGNKQGDLSIDKGNVGQIFESVDFICTLCFVEPKVWTNDEADETHMPVSWLSFADREFVFGWALGVEYQAASSFRPEQGANVDAVQPVPGVSANARRGNRNHR